MRVNLRRLSWAALSGMGIIVFLAIYPRVDYLQMHQVEWLPLKAILTMVSRKLGRHAFNKAWDMSGVTEDVGASRTVTGKKGMWLALDYILDLSPLIGFILGFLSLDDANLLYGLLLCAGLATIVASLAWTVMTIIFKWLHPSRT